jgi:hypothetical protein
MVAHTHQDVLHVRLLELDRAKNHNKIGGTKVYAVLWKKDDINKKVHYFLDR